MKTYISLTNRFLRQAVTLVLLIGLHVVMIGFVISGLRASYEGQMKFNQRMQQMRHKL